MPLDILRKSHLDGQDTSLCIFNCPVCPGGKPAPEGRTEQVAECWLETVASASVKLWLGPCRCAGQLFTYHAPSRQKLEKVEVRQAAVSKWTFLDPGTFDLLLFRVTRYVPPVFSVS